MPNLAIHSSQQDPFMVLSVAGELDLATQPEFERVVLDHLSAWSVVVDLSGLDFFAISGLRSLELCQNAAAAGGHELVYAAPSAQLRRLLSLSGLDAVLAVRSSLAEALCRPQLSRQPTGVSSS